MPKGAPATESDRATAALDYIASREGLLLVTQLVVSRNKYLFYVGDSAPTMGGLRRVHGDLNLDRRFDSRVNPRRPGGRKAPNERPPDGFDGLVAVNPRATWYNVQTDQGIPFHCLVFHELAEAYGKVSLRLQYLPGHGFPGAHELALEREINLQNQRPFSGVIPTAGGNLLFDTSKDWVKFIVRLHSSSERELLDTNLLRGFQQHHGRHWWSALTPIGTALKSANPPGISLFTGTAVVNAR